MESQVQVLTWGDDIPLLDELDDALWHLIQLMARRVGVRHLDYGEGCIDNEFISGIRSEIMKQIEQVYHERQREVSV